jgi:hypothetical protein
LNEGLGISADDWHANNVRCESLRMVLGEGLKVFLEWFCAHYCVKPPLAAAHDFFNEFVELDEQRTAADNTVMEAEVWISWLDKQNIGVLIIRKRPATPP